MYIGKGLKRFLGERLICMSFSYPFMSYQTIQSNLAACADTAKKEVYQRFFKTGKGEYGEGDSFIGVTIPQQRIIARKHIDATAQDIQQLLASPIHEHRMTGLLILVYQYKESTTKKQHTAIVNTYLKNLSGVNNWDLVDVSAYALLGSYMVTYRDKTEILKKYVVSKNVWKRRIAIVATYAYIKNGNIKPTVEIARLLRDDTHDLIQKAVGWMLREAWKQQPALVSVYIRKHAAQMPRTMLRYAIERFPEKQRKEILERSLN